MPLIVISGLPASGKSRAATALADACRQRGQEVQIVGEDSLHLTRNDSYKGAQCDGGGGGGGSSGRRRQLAWCLLAPSVSTFPHTVQTLRRRRWRAARCCRRLTAA